MLRSQQDDVFSTSTTPTRQEPQHDLQSLAYNMTSPPLTQENHEGHVDHNNQGMSLEMESRSEQHESPTSDVTKPGIIPEGQQETIQAPQRARPGQFPLEFTPQNNEIRDSFNHLSEHEKQILKRQLDLSPANVSYITLYRYATMTDKIILVVASLASIIGGALLPLMTVLFGGLAGSFQGLTLGNTSQNEFTSELATGSLYFVYLAIGEFVMVYIATAGFLFAGERISSRIREQFLAAILRQNIAFFDGLGAGEITTQITADISLVQEGISEKVGLTLAAMSTFVAAFVISFIQYWKLTLILSSTVVAIVLTMGGLGSFIGKLSKTYIAQFAQGGTVAEVSHQLHSKLNSVPHPGEAGTTIQYIPHQGREGWVQTQVRHQFYDWVHVPVSTPHGRLPCCLRSSRSFHLEHLQVLTFSPRFVYLNYGLAFWMGSRFLVEGSVGLSQILTIQMSIMMGAFALGNVAPNIQAFSSAVAAANKIYAVIDRVSPLDPTSTEGQKLAAIQGNVELRNIKHVYPSRPEVVVMDGVDLLIPAGKSTAIVGASGSGKSTIVGLIERFYDPVGGSVYIDGHDITTLNLSWLRQQISLVSQEPVLFSTSIYENIKHGLIGTAQGQGSEEAVRELVESAAKKANVSTAAIIRSPSDILFYVIIAEVYDRMMF